MQSWITSLSTSYSSQIFSMVVSPSGISDQTFFRTLLKIRGCDERRPSSVDLFSSMFATMFWKCNSFSPVFLNRSSISLTTFFLPIIFTVLCAVYIGLVLFCCVQEAFDYVVV